MSKLVQAALVVNVDAIHMLEQVSEGCACVALSIVDTAPVIWRVFLCSVS